MASTRMTRMTRSLMALALASGAAWPAWAQPATAFTFTPSADTSLFVDITGTNPAYEQVSDGQGSSLWLDTTAGGVLRRALLRFDLGAIPAGWQVSAVTLTLYQSRARSVHDVALHRVLAPWGEGASDGGAQGNGAPAQAGDATWRWRDYGVSEWQQPGGDFVAQASASTFVGQPNQAYTWGSSAGMVADVQHWLDQPGSNHGWILIGAELDAQNAKRFESSESLQVELRPLLTVLAAPVPEPASALLLALGGGSLLLLRRPRPTTA